MTFEVARQIAQEEALRRKLSPRLAKYEFEPVVLDSENEVSWLFVSASEQLQDEGCIPGAIFVRVDKRDGHIWSEREVEQYYESLAARLRSDNHARV
ncbi:MAG: hypothetical protein L0229_19480 [Blastocatellia bacterium]|nr:hypothetical protein [Blastocatellia bacterium]